MHEGLEFENVYNHYIKEYIELSEEDCSKCWAGKLCDICLPGVIKTEREKVNLLESIFIKI